MNDQLWLEPLGLEEKPLELRVAEVLGLRLVRPGGVQALEEKRIGVPDPKSRLRREPIEPLQPVDGQLQPVVIEHLRLVRLLAG